MAVKPARKRPVSETGWTEAQRAWPDGVQFAARPRVAAREQRYVMSQLDQLIEEPSHHPLSAAEKGGRMHRARLSRARLDLIVP
jgi:hypothetical protein